MAEVRRNLIVCSVFLILFVDGPLLGRAIAAPKAAQPSSSTSSSTSKDKPKAQSKSKCEPLDDDYYESFFASQPKASTGAQAVGKSNCKTSPTPVSSQESEISGLAQKFAEPDPALVPDACIGAAMVRRPAASSTYLYAKCDSDSPEAVVTTRCVPAPRLTDNYIRFTRNAFIRAFQCLGEDPRQYVGLIGLESAFQLNIGNTANAWGPGQITSAAGTPELFGQWFDKYREKPECAGLSEVMSLRGQKKPKACLITAPPSNPLRGFLVAGLLFKHMRDYAGSLVPKSVTGAERTKIVREMAMQMYNAGDTGVASCWRNYLADHPGGGSSYEAFQGFTQYLAENYGNGLEYFEKNTKTRDAVRFAVSHYVNAAKGAGDAANSKSKGCAI